MNETSLHHLIRFLPMVDRSVKDKDWLVVAYLATLSTGPHLAREIASGLRISPRQLRERTSKLKKLGLIEVEECGQKGNRYSLRPLWDQLGGPAR